MPVPHSVSRTGCSSVRIEEPRWGASSSIADLIPSSRTTRETWGGRGRLSLDMKSPYRTSGFRERQIIASPRWLCKIKCKGIDDNEAHRRPRTANKFASTPRTVANFVRPGVMFANIVRKQREAAQLPATGLWRDSPKGIVNTEQGLRVTLWRSETRFDKYRTCPSHAWNEIALSGKAALTVRI